MVWTRLPSETPAALRGHCTCWNPLPILQGVEAVLHVLHDCYGYNYPGGLFLAAVDLMLEKATAVQPVLELLQAIAGAGCSNRCAEAGL